MIDGAGVKSISVKTDKIPPFQRHVAHRAVKLPRMHLYRPDDLESGGHQSMDWPRIPVHDVSNVLLATVTRQHHGKAVDHHQLDSKLMMPKPRAAG